MPKTRKSDSSSDSDSGPEDVRLHNIFINKTLLKSTNFRELLRQRNPKTLLAVKINPKITTMNPKTVGF